MTKGIYFNLRKTFKCEAKRAELIVPNLLIYVFMCEQKVVNVHTAFMSQLDFP